MKIPSLKAATVDGHAQSVMDEPSSRTDCFELTRAVTSDSRETLFERDRWKRKFLGDAPKENDG